MKHSHNSHSHHNIDDSHHSDNTISSIDVIDTSYNYEKWKLFCDDISSSSLDAWLDFFELFMAMTCIIVVVFLIQFFLFSKMKHLANENLISNKKKKIIFDGLALSPIINSILFMVFSGSEGLLPGIHDVDLFSNSPIHIWRALGLTYTSIFLLWSYHCLKKIDFNIESLVMKYTIEQLLGKK